jgi:GNAT superfamily N-acetyltransferase
MTDGTAGFLVRPAREGDLDVIAGFEIDIARASFGDEAIEDAALHRKRVAAALGKPGEVTLVAVAVKGDSEEGMGRRAGGGGDGAPVGWAWLTGARYGNFRSLATADIPGRGIVAELLMAAVMQAAAQAGYTHLTGKTHAGNLGMRALYRKFGFEATHLTMEWRPGAPAAGEPGGEAGR